MHLLWPTVIITASLSALVWLTQILKFLDFVLSRGLSMQDFFYLTGLMLPSLLLVLIPIGLTIAVIYTYNKLMVESELIVLNSVGVSKWQLAKPALMIGLICAAFCYLLSLVVLPLANSKFQDIRTFFRDKYASVLLEEEVFNNPLNGVTVFVRERDRNNNLSGILMHDSRNANQVITMLADQGRVEQTETGPRFHLQNGMRQEWKDGKVSWLAFDDYAVDIAFYGQTEKRVRRPDERTISELFEREGLSEKQIATFRAEAHHRLTWPLFTLALPLFVLAVLFSSEFNRRGQLRRIVVASLGVVVILLFFFTIRNMSLKHLWMLGLLYLVVLGISAFSIHVLVSGRVIRYASRESSSKAEGV